MSDATIQAPVETTAPQSQSAQIGKLAAALVKAQASIKAAKKDANNPHFGYRYSTLSEVWDVIREPLTDNGLAVMQLPTPTDGSMVSVVTVLVHDSGEYIRSEISMPLRPEFTKTGQQLPAGPQHVGSCITYARRYALTAMVGVASADDDDDGNAASREHEPTATPPAAKPGNQAKVDQMRAEGRIRQVPAVTAAPSEPASAPTSITPTPPVAQPKPPATQAAVTQDCRAFHARLYEACQAAGVLVEELQQDLMSKGILKGQMRVDNLGEPIVNALLDGKDKGSGRRNWDIVVDRIKAGRK